MFEHFISHAPIIGIILCLLSSVINTKVAIIFRGSYPPGKSDRILMFGPLGGYDKIYWLVRYCGAISSIVVPVKIGVAEGFLSGVLAFFAYLFMSLFLAIIFKRLHILPGIFTLSSIGGIVGLALLLLNIRIL